MHASASVGRSTAGSAASAVAGNAPRGRSASSTGNVPEVDAVAERAERAHRRLATKEGRRTRNAPTAGALLSLSPVAAASIAAGAAQPPRISTAMSETSVGVRPTRTPLASSASAFACAVPALPETIAPAWPIVLPGGAVKPAM